MESALGQPLRASVGLVGAETGALLASCVKGRIESSDGVFITSANVTLGRAGQTNSILLTSRQPINEPAISVAIDIGCDTQVHRDFQVLLDPVALMQPSAVASVLSERASRVADMPSRSQRVNRAVGSEATRSRRVGSDQTPRPRRDTAQQPPGLMAASALAPSGTSRNVLKLSSDALTKEDLRSLGHLKLAGELSEPALPIDAARRDALRVDQARFGMLLRGEDPLVNAEKAGRLSREKISQLNNQAASAALQRAADQTALEQLRLRVMPLSVLIGLGALLLLSLLAVGWLAWRLSQVRRQGSGPWDVSQPPTGVEHDEPVVPLFDDSAPMRPANRSLFSIGKKPQPSLSAVPAFVPPVIVADAQTTERLGVPAVPPATVPSGRDEMQFYPAKVDNLKVEEISDVLQEAEFWMSLNDPQRAIEILESYSNVERPISPLTWLFLLDLYRGTDERVKYDALRERAQRIFNARVPGWDEDGDATEFRTLEDYPHVVEQICEYWDTDHILIYLESLIYDNREGARQGFDLPVYQEIMLLITMARGMDHNRGGALIASKRQQLTI